MENLSLYSLAQKSQQDKKNLEKYLEYILRFDAEESVDMSDDEKAYILYKYFVEPDLNIGGVEEMDSFFTKKIVLEIISFFYQQEDYFDNDFIEERKDYFIDVLKKTKSLGTLFFFSELLSASVDPILPKEIEDIFKTLLQCPIVFPVTEVITRKLTDGFRIYHDLYYKYIETEEKSFVFYVRYAKDNTDSIYYRFMIGESLDYNELGFNILDEEENCNYDGLIAIMKKYPSICSYDESVNFINEIDNFFSENTGVCELSERILSDIVNNELDIDNIEEIILIMYTRCNHITTFAFALSILRIFKYFEKEEEYYADLMMFAKDYHLTKLALFALTMHPDFEKICRKFVKYGDTLVAMAAFPFLDFSKERNISAFIKRSSDPNFFENIIAQTYDDINLNAIMNDKNASNNKIKFVKNCILKLALLETEFAFEEENIKIIKKLFTSYVDTNKIKALDLIGVLLFILDTNLENKACKDLYDFLKERFNYDEAIAFIDEKIEDNSCKDMSINYMMSFVNYVPTEKIVAAIKRNFKKNLHLIPSLVQNDNDAAIECMEFIDKNYNIEPRYLEKDYLGDEHVKPTTSYDDSSNLILLVNLAQTLDYQPKRIIKYGLSFFREIIRERYYDFVDGLYEKNLLQDKELFEFIEEEYPEEKNPYIKAAMENILAIKEIKIS